ncbi:5989_t:CDS:2, partial [Entrophospora sp. SA101]
IDVVDKVVTRLWLIIWNVLLVSVVVIKSAHVSKGLSTAMNTVLITNPSLPKQLNHQKCTGGFLLEFNSLAGPASGSINIREAQKSLEEIKSDKNLGYKERAKNLFIFHGVLAKRKYLYVLPIRITDHLDSVWMFVDPYGYENHVKNQLWETYIFKACTQLKTFNKTLLNNNLVAISEIDYVTETDHLCEKINELEKYNIF